MVTVIDNQGKTAGEEKVDFPRVEEPSLALLAQAVRVFLSNQRKAQAKAKTRSAVVGSGAKIWRQKGTGRARHGARQAPIFVGGGVAHGPTGTQNYRRKLTQKMIQKALLTVLAEKIKEKKLYLVDELNFQKTKEASAFCRKIRENFSVKGKMAFLLAKNEKAQKFLRNLTETAVLSTESLSPYPLLQNDFLVVTKPAWQALEKRFTGKEKINERKH